MLGEGTALNSGNQQALEPQGRLIRPVGRLDLQLNAVPVIGVRFRVAATHDAVIVGHQQRAVGAFRVVGEIGRAEDVGGGIAGRAGIQARGAKGLGAGRGRQVTAAAT